MFCSYKVPLMAVGWAGTCSMQSFRDLGSLSLCEPAIFWGSCQVLCIHMRRKDHEVWFCGTSPGSHSCHLHPRGPLNRIQSHDTLTARDPGKWGSVPRRSRKWIWRTLRLQKRLQSAILGENWWGLLPSSTGSAIIMMTMIHNSQVFTGCFWVSCTAFSSLHAWSHLNLSKSLCCR